MMRRQGHAGSCQQSGGCERGQCSHRAKPRAHSSANRSGTRIEYPPMKARFLLLISAVFALGATACSSTPTGKSVVSDVIAAMGGDKVKTVQTISMKGGSGTRGRLQEQRRVTDPDEPGTLTDVLEIVDLAGNRASLDYQFKEGGFGQHRHEVLTTRGGKP